jgi:regulator of sigma E protease
MPSMLDPLLAVSIDGLVSIAWTVLQVALGLGFVIFVHELGHFAVAKMCGVRCDKFFLGFDVGGYKISKKWGETEYGIGILPLGGYVKMLGQEDTVASLEEQLAKSRALEGSPEAVQVTGPDGTKQWVHNRSYLAKSVPQRMAIISAGVIMNVIFAVVFAAIAFRLGAPEEPADVGGTAPGGAAWRAGLRPGDRIAKLDGVADPTYKSLVEAVLFGDPAKGVELLVERPGAKPRTVAVLPDLDSPLPRIGVSPTNALRLSSTTDPNVPNSPAGEAAKEKRGFQRGDQIVALNGVELTTYAELLRELLKNAAQPVTYTVVRGGTPPVSDPFGELRGGERVEVTLDPNPRETLGITVAMGPVAAVQKDSPAEMTGVKPGDRIVAIDGAPVAQVAADRVASDAAPLDPLAIDDLLSAKARAGESVTLTLVRRGDEGTVEEVSVSPRALEWLEQARDEDHPLAITTLGVACPLVAEVVAVTPNGPAAEAGVEPGDRLLSAKLLSGTKGDAASGEAIRLDGGKDSWPLLVSALQDKSPEFRVELEVERDGKSRTVKLATTVDPTGFSHARGAMLTPLKRLRVADTMGEAFQLGLAETGTALSSVYRFLQKIGGQIPVTALGGPITIATAAGASAYEGVGALLLFLTMLSANLAILNFLPIPMLDGGHMMFLLYEGITGRPASEKFVVWLHTAGFMFLISLMAFVFALDLGLIPRGL